MELNPEDNHLFSEQLDTRLAELQNAASYGVPTVPHTPRAPLQGNIHNNLQTQFGGDGHGMQAYSTPVHNMAASYHPFPLPSTPYPLRPAPFPRDHFFGPHSFNTPNYGSPVTPRHSQACESPSIPNTTSTRAVKRAATDPKPAGEEPITKPVKKVRRGNGKENEEMKAVGNDVEVIDMVSEGKEVSKKSTPVMAEKDDKPTQVTKMTPLQKKLKAEEEVISSVRSHWTDEERTELFMYLLGPDADKTAEKLKVNPGRVFAKASKALFDEKYKPAAIKGQYERSLKVFGYIIAFEGFTGGGGDADETSDENSDKESNETNLRIDAARKGGRSVGNLNAKVLEKWYENGWYEFFKSRHGKSPKVVRPVIHNSALALSETDPGLAGDDSSSDSSSSVTVKMSSSNKRKLSKHASKVTEPKHKARNQLRQQTLAGASGLNGYLTTKAEIDKARFDDMKRRHRIELAKEMIADPSTPEELRTAAKATLLKALED